MKKAGGRLRADRDGKEGLQELRRTVADADGSGRGRGAGHQLSKGLRVGQER